MHIAVIGAGPAGLMAAHAATLNGHEVVILSKGGSERKSRLYGSQYLHEEIPGIDCGEAHRVKYRLVGGTLADYRQKVYGSKWDGDVSPKTLDDVHWAWDIRRAYDDLWAKYSHLIRDMDFQYRGQGNVDMVQDMMDVNDVDKVISSIPRKAWDANDGNFQSSFIWAAGDAPEQGIEVPIRPFSDFTVECDASSEVGLYRLSQVFGHVTVEWPEKAKPPIKNVAKVEKPLAHASTAADFITHVGRYGEWQKGILTTDAFRKALQCTE